MWNYSETIFNRRYIVLIKVREKSKSGTKTRAPANKFISDVVVKNPGGESITPGLLQLLNPTTR